MPDKVKHEFTRIYARSGEQACRFLLYQYLKIGIAGRKMIEKPFPAIYYSGPYWV